MSEVKAKSNKPSIIGAAIIAGTIGLSGGYVANDQIAPTAAVIESSVEHEIAFGSGVTNLTAVGMVAKGLPNHIHFKWDNNILNKGYHVYIDGKKVTTDPVAGVGDTVHYSFIGNLDGKQLKIGKEYSVSVSAIDASGKESVQSEAVKVTIK